MKKITLVEALDALKQARDERGANFLYSSHYYTASCLYVEGDIPACIAGNALYRLGVPLDILRRMDRASSNGGSDIVSSDRVIEILEEAGFQPDKDALNALSRAQADQDARQTWGTAYDSAWQF